VSSVVLIVHLLTYYREAYTESLGSCYSLILALVSSLPWAPVRVEGPLPPLVRRGVRTTVGILEVTSGFALLLRGS
jgi:hypothetical protein